MLWNTSPTTRMRHLTVFTRCTGLRHLIIAGFIKRAKERLMESTEQNFTWFSKAQALLGKPLVPLSRFRIQTTSHTTWRVWVDCMMEKCAPNGCSSLREVGIALIDTTASKLPNTPSSPWALKTAQPCTNKKKFSTQRSTRKVPGRLEQTSTWVGGSCTGLIRIITLRSEII